MGYTFPMLSYYLIAAGAFTLGFLAAAALISGRRAQAGRERAWLADEVAKFAAQCRRDPNSGDFLIAPAELERLKEAAAPAHSTEQ